MYTYEISGNTVTVLSHEAMATIFELHLIHDNKNYIAQAALEAFSDLDQIEQDLSRFLDHSDISRINNLKPGESTVVSEHTFACLQSAVKYFNLTDKIFDISLGCEINELKKKLNPSGKIKKSGSSLENLQINESDFSVVLASGSTNLDLGGVGKGYAIDYLKNLLIEWQIDHFLIQGGRSTVLVTDIPGKKDGWPVSLSYPDPPHKHFETLFLKNHSLSSSGLQKKNHIYDPRSGSVADTHKATWVIAGDAVVSDILSTTFMMLSNEEILEFCRESPEISYICIDQHDNILRSDKKTK